jgi:stage II sporulation protein D
MQEMKIRKIIILNLVLGFGFLVLGNAEEPSQAIRVAIIQDAATLSLKVKGAHEITDLSGNKVLYHGYNLKTTVTAYKGGILLGKMQSDIPKILIKARESGEILIDGRRFRGDILLVKNSNSHLTVVNSIGLEDYIKGILYHEASHYWPMEALKAQAIVCRSYAIYQMAQKKNKDFDVTSDIYSQVYGGRTSERYRTNSAVVDTAGGVITFQGKVIPAYFHATCGGHTEDSSMLWNINLAPLKGVACGFCKESPHFNWHYVFSLDELAEKLNSAGYKIKDIKDIVILGKDNSGRITDLNFISSKKELKISAKDFRMSAGPNIIRSTNFSVKVVENDAVFEGIGWGHGVGLCQWGAYFMAKQGSSAEEILKYYYPGTQISQQ